MNKFFEDLLKVNGQYHLKRVLALVFAVAILISWIAQQFFSFDIPQQMFQLLTDIFKSVVTEIPNH